MASGLPCLDPVSCENLDRIQDAGYTGRLQFFFVSFLCCCNFKK